LDCIGRCALPGDFVNSVGMQFILVHPGSFLRGSPRSERGRQADENQHKVNLTCGFYIGVTEVTQGQYLSVMGVNPSLNNGGEFGVNLSRPVEGMAWNGAVAFCRELSRRESIRYRLPTEAEWEYACRAGTTTRFWFGDALECSDECVPCESIDDFEWTCGNRLEFWSHPVGLKQPNPWGLYDMHGNVSECCHDWYDWYPIGEVTNPVVLSPGRFGQMKVIRGFGNFRLDWERSATRGRSSPGTTADLMIGFRVVLPLPACDQVPTTP
jgi:formylglycine-generating enzyme required for sulfatase activity